MGRKMVVWSELAILQRGVFEIARSVETVFRKQAENERHVCGLFYEINSTKLAYPFSRFGLYIAGNHNGHYRKIFRPYMLQYLIAVHLWHIEVEKHQVCLARPQLLQCFSAVICEQDRFGKAGG